MKSTPMQNYWNIILAIILWSSLYCSTINAQNCTVNTGVLQEVCLGERIVLSGSLAGTYENGIVQWRILSQPDEAAIQLENAASLLTKTSPILVEGTYIFELEAACETGLASQTITYIVNKLEATIEPIELPSSPCMPCETVLTFVGNTIDGANFTWELLEGSAIATLETPFQSTTNVYFPCNPLDCNNEGMLRLAYTVTKNGCSVTEVIAFFATVDYKEVLAVVEQEEVSPCPPYAEICNTFMGSCPSGGIGEWTISEQPPGSNLVIDTPNEPIISLCDLMAGTYRLMWSVTGEDACTVGSAIVEFEVMILDYYGVTLPEITPGEYVFCAGDVPHSVSFSGSSPQVNETGLWYQLAGPDATILKPTSPDVIITDLVSGECYQFVYEICSPIECCLDTVFIYETSERELFFNRDDNAANVFSGCSDQYLIQSTQKGTCEGFIGEESCYDFIAIFATLTAYPPAFSVEDDLTLRLGQNSAELTPELLTPDIFNRTISLQDNQALWHFSASCLDSPLSYISIKMDQFPYTGTYTFDIRIQVDCQEALLSTASFTVREKGILGINAGSDQLLSCNESSTELIGQPSGGEWSLIAAPPTATNPINDPFAETNIQIDNLIAGIYTFQYATSSLISCALEGNSIISDEVVVVVSNDLPPPFELSDTTICATNEFVLPILLTPFAGNWQQLTGEATSLLDNPTRIVGLQPNTTYSFEYTITNACGASKDTFQLQTTDSVLEEALILTADSCSVIFQNTIVFPLEAQAITAGNTGIWTYLGDAEVLFSPSANDPNITVTLTDAETSFHQFIWTVDNSLCENSSRDTFIFRPINPPSPLLEDYIQDCAAQLPDTFLLAPALAISAGNSADWTLIQQIPNGILPTILSPTNDSTQVVLYESGVYIFRLTYNYLGDCGAAKVEEFIELKVSQAGSQAVITSNSSFCEGETVALNALAPTVGNGTWTVLTTSPNTLELELEDPSASTTTVHFSEAGIATIRWSVTSEDPSCGISSQNDITIEYYDFDIKTQDTVLCGASILIVEHSDISVGNGTWQVASGPNMPTIVPSSSTSTLFGALIPGDYQLVYEFEAADGTCLIMDELAVRIEALPLFSLPTFKLCKEELLSSQTITIPLPEFPAGYTDISWEVLYKPNGATENLLLNPDSTILYYTNVVETGFYDVRVTLLNGSCALSDNSIIEILPSFTYALPDASTCVGMPIFLNENPNTDYNYNWNNAVVLDDTTLASPSFLGMESTTFFVTITNSDGCTMVDDLSVVVHEVDLNLPVLDTTLCHTMSLTLNANSSDAIRYLWSDTPDFTSELSTTNSLDIIASDATYYVQVEDANMCLNMDSVVVSRAILEATISDDLVLCAIGDTIELAVEIADASTGMSFTYDWESNDAMSDFPSADIIFVHPEATTTYSVLLSDEFGCSQNLATTISLSSLAENIVASANPMTITSGESSQLDLMGCEEECNYLWQPSTTLDDATIADPLANPLETTTYSVEITDEFCSTTAAVTIVVLSACDEPFIYLPNAFSPNGDGENDAFEVRANVLTDLYLVIYSRWGEKVFETHEIKGQWDGTYKGERLKPDVFGFYMEATCINGATFRKQGNVSLLR